MITLQLDDGETHIIDEQDIENLKEDSPIPVAVIDSLKGYLGDHNQYDFEQILEDEIRSEIDREINETFPEEGFVNEE